MKQIQEWLGHSDFSTTANIYAHMDPRAKISSAEAMVWGLGLEDSDEKEWVGFAALRRGPVAALTAHRAVIHCRSVRIPSFYEYNNTNRKSREHINMLWELSKWNDGRY